MIRLIIKVAIHTAIKRPFILVHILVKLITKLFNVKQQRPFNDYLQYLLPGINLALKIADTSGCLTIASELLSIKFSKIHWGEFCIETPFTQ